MLQKKTQVKYRHDYCAPKYKISDINLTFYLDAEKTIVTAVSQVSRQSIKPIPLHLDGESLTLVSLRINNQEWANYKEENNQLVINNLPEKFTLHIVNIIHPIANTALKGLYQSGTTLCTQCEAEGFRHITWYLDRPDILASFTTKIIANKALYPFLLSNGNRVGEGDLENGQHWVQWHDPFPKPCYLFALAAGDFNVMRNTFLTSSGRRVALEIFVNQGELNCASWAMTSLINSMKWDEERFGLEYDLDIYMIVAVDFFNMGAMENKGLNIFNSRYILANTNTATDKDYLDIERVIGHEYFHNWTGNRVTCRDWFQLSLKEGLTVFRDQEFSSDLGSRVVNRINNVRTMRSLQFAEDNSPIAHPIRPNKFIEVNNLYTLTVYEKGAEVIRMIHTLLGEMSFQKGMRLYFKRHDGNAVTCDDFIQAMEDASNIDLSQFRLWYSQVGTPILHVKSNYNQETHQYTLTVSQSMSLISGKKKKSLLHIPVNIELYDSQGEVIPLNNNRYHLYYILNITQAQQSFTFSNIYSKPVPALLCDFSAPVKLEYKWSDQELIFLMLNAQNDFSRWDAAQNLLTNYIKLNVNYYQRGQSLSLPDHVADAFRAVLLHENIDPALISEILTMPSIIEIAEFFEVIDPIAITVVREEIIRLLATKLTNEFIDIYNINKLNNYNIKHNDINKRSLRNTCLYYLAFCKTELTDNLVSSQYYHANNMTDTIAALSSSIAAKLACSKIMMQEYDDKWYLNGLVMDKWFILHAANSSVNVVRNLLKHRSFNMKNPNRIRSLIGTFVNYNLAEFHASDGSGYQFIVKLLIDLNSYNPQIASRLIEPLIRFKRYDANRQYLMCTALKQLKELKNLSIDLYEKITKALN